MGSAQFRVSRVEILTCKGWKYFAAVIAANISGNISRIVSRSISLACLEIIHGISKSEASWHFPQWRSPFQSEEGSFYFIDDAVTSIDLVTREDKTDLYTIHNKSFDEDCILEDWPHSFLNPLQDLAFFPGCSVRAAAC